MKQSNNRIQTARDSVPGPTREVRIYNEVGNRAGEVAKELLEQRGIPFREINVEEDYLLRGWIAWATGRRGLPQIFVDGEPIGGTKELLELDEADKLIERITR